MTDKPLILRVVSAAGKQIDFTYITYIIGRSRFELPQTATFFNFKA